MSIQTQKKKMKEIYSLVSRDLSYIYGEREGGPNGYKSAAFLRAPGKDLGFKEMKVMNNHGGIAVSGEITLTGMWSDGNGLYFQISQTFIQPPSFPYRSITRMKDYGGERNQWLHCYLFRYEEYEEPVSTLLKLRKPIQETGVTKNAA